jgi:hypothetical protein
MRKILHRAQKKYNADYESYIKTDCASPTAHGAFSHKLDGAPEQIATITYRYWQQIHQE